MFGGRHRVVLVLDGELYDAAAVNEAGSLVGGDASQLLVLLVPFWVADWAHFEVGDDPRSLRRDLDLEQRTVVRTMFAAAGLSDEYLLEAIPAGWRNDRLRGLLTGCETVILASRKRRARLRIQWLAKRAGANLRLVDHSA